MLLTALPPAPPTPNTVMRGLSSVRSGTLRLMVMAAFRSFICPLLRLASRRFPAMRRPRALTRSKIVPYPVADLGEIAGAGTQEALLARGRTACRRRAPNAATGRSPRRNPARRPRPEAAHGARPAKPCTGRPNMLAASSDRPVSWLPPPVSTRCWVTSAAEPARGKPPPHQIENFLDARTDDDGELRLGDLVQASAAACR